MSDSVLPLLRDALKHADGCYTESNGVIGNLEEALEMLPENDTEIQATIDKLMSKTFELMDTCSALSNDLNELRLKYRASYMPSQKVI